jgi:RNA polymerase primary sigma factor
MNTPPFLKLSKDYPLLSYVEEVDLAKRIEKCVGRRRQDAVDKLVYSNVRLVKKILNHYKWLNLDDDLFSEGLIGLCLAVEKYDYRKGNRFSTFAYYWIRHKMHRFMEQNINIIKIPVHIQDTLKVYYQTYEKLLIEKNDHPSIEEISLVCGISVFKLSKAVKFGIFTVNSLCSSDNNEEWQIEDKSMDLKDIEFRVSLEEIMGDMSSEEVKVLYSLLNNEELDLDELGMNKEKYEDLKDKLKEKLMEKLWSE